MVLGRFRPRLNRDQLMPMLLMQCYPTPPPGLFVPAEHRSLQPCVLSALHAFCFYSRLNFGPPRSLPRAIVDIRAVHN